MKSNKRVRVRFAPSPTGGLHIGGLRTALFNYLFAKKNQGDFILRIEDTDQSRFVEGAESYIVEALSWIGLHPDEGPEQGGTYAPYRQSERKEIYIKHVHLLLEKGFAYYAFDTPEELEVMRSKLKEAGAVNLNYNSASRMTMKNSLTLPPDEVAQRIDAGESYVIRIKIPIKEEIRFEDHVRGWVHVHSSTLDDKVILKSDGLPTYHLANVVDDHLMEVTHVIRGEEWLPSTPLHVLLYKYFGWEDNVPEFAHLPLILKPDGNGKLSKRAADKAGIPIFPLTWKDPENETDSVGFREKGYLAEAMVNFLALLGWNPGTDQEIFSLDELAQHFSLERIGKAGTKFDIDKARWFNQQYIHHADDNVLADDLKARLLKLYNIDIPDHQQLVAVVTLLKTRVTFINELVTESLIFFESPSDFDEKVLGKKWNLSSEKALTSFAEQLRGQKPDIIDEDIRALFHHTMQELEINPGSVMQILRVSITGLGSGPDLMKIISIMGPNSAADRIIDSINTFKERQSV